MTTRTVHNGKDAVVEQDHPGKPRPGGTWLRAQPGEWESFIRMKSPAPRGVSVPVATWTFTQVDDVSGSVTAELQPLGTDGFQAGEVSWNNRPTNMTGVAAPLTKVSPNKGAKWVFDVSTAYQAIANGTHNRGFRLKVTSGNQVKWYSLDASRHRPILTVSWNKNPQQPTRLHPSFAATSLSKWIQRCDFTDKAGDTSLRAVQVQIDAAGDFTTGIDFDSGEVLAESPQLDLATTAYAGLALDATTTLRMRVQDGNSLWSPWSDPVTITRKAKGVLTLNSPGASPNDYVTEYTPPVTWSFTGTQTHYRITVARSTDPKKLLYDTDRKQSTATTHTIPARVLSGVGPFIVSLYVWDDVTREGTANDPAYVLAEREFTVQFDGTVTAASAVVLETPPNGAPWRDLLITRATSPDSWTLVRSELPAGLESAVKTDVVPGDVQVDSTHWRVRDHTMRPGVTYRIRPRAEVNGKLASGGPTVDVVSDTTAIWLWDPEGEDTDYAVMGGRDWTAAMPDNAVTHQVMGAIETVRTVMGLNGLSGAVTNLMVRDRAGRTWREYEDTLYDFKSRPTGRFRLLLGSWNIPVVIGDLVVQPHEATRPDQPLLAVSFSFWQSGEHPFEVTF